MLLAVVAILGYGTTYAFVPETSDLVPQKVAQHDPRPFPPSGDAGGETFADAVDMVALPFHDADNLWNYANDIDFGYGTSPDVVYKYTPDHDGCITVDGCASQYDQMIFVVDEAQTTIVAFNDDGAACGNTSSQIAWLQVYTGVLYYYVIDGYGGSAGPYDLNVFWRDCPPPVECPAGAQLEGEPCADPYVDNYNGGCNSTPSVFSTVNAVCDPTQTIVICGTNFNYYTGTSGRRDTDWYLLADLPLMGATQIFATSYYEASGSLYFIHIVDPCTADIPAGIHVGSRELAVLDWLCDPTDGSRWAIFQSKNYYDPTWYPCTSPESWPYILTIDNYVYTPVTPTETNSWGAVKSLFKLK
jgi:hypothetical protein